MKLTNPILIALNNTLHIKADNLEAVEVDSSLSDFYYNYINEKFTEEYRKMLKEELIKGIDFSELSDRIEVNDKVLTIIDDKWCYTTRAFLLPVKEDKVITKTIRQFTGDKFVTINGTTYYPIEEIERALRKTNDNEGQPLTNKFIGCFFGELTKTNNLKK